MKTNLYHTYFSLLAILSVLLGAIVSPLAALAAPLNGVAIQPQAAVANALEAADARPFEAAPAASERALEKAVEAPVPAPAAAPNQLPGQPTPVILGNSSITVTKSVVGSSQSNYTVTITGPSYPSGANVPITSGTQVITGLVSGIYTLTEVSPGAGWTTTYTATTGYSTGSSAIVTLTNPITATLSGVSQITGKVYRDFNSDGQITANGTITDTGVQSVTVTAYDPNGNVVGTAQVTNASGLYTITTGGVPGPYRVEFSNLPADYEPTSHGTQNGTSVQFVTTAGGASNVNLGVAQSCDYCQTSPKLAFSRFESGTGSGTNSTNKSVGTIAYNHSGSAAAAASFAGVGSVWGISYDNLTKRIYTSAFLKRHVGLGPRGMDGIYVIDNSGATPALLGGFDLEGLTASNGGTIALGSVTRTGGANFTLNADPTQPTIDLDAFGKVGRVGYGDIDMANGSQILWVVNLNDRTLIAVDTSQIAPVSGSTANLAPAAAVRQYRILSSSGASGAPSLTGAPTCTAGELRPFGLKITSTRGYLGVVCDASSSSTLKKSPDLHAYVLSFDPANPTSLTTEVDFTLDYKREPYYQMQDGTNVRNGEWQRWMNTWNDADIDTNGTTASCCGGMRSAPQPLLSDIEIMPDGSLVLGMIDRFAHQTGWSNRKALSGDTSVLEFGSVGDILLAKRVGSGYVMESGEGDPGDPYPDGDSTPDPEPGYANNDSVGSAGEFFYGDALKGSDASHHETAVGGLTLLPGSNEVVSTAFDPDQFTAQGLIWLSTQTGAKTDSWSHSINTWNVQLFGKAAGMGDVELLCNPAPIEIGNRVWYDIDGDGVQDAGEPGISGVQVSLQTISGTVNITTDINGNYYFTREAASGSYSTTLRPNTAYTLTINSIPSGYSLTQANAAVLAGASVSSNHAISDVRDSDAALVGGVATIYYTTGSIGQNNHGLDFGFTKPATGTVQILNTYTPPGTIQVTKQVTTTDGTVQTVPGSFTINVDCGGATVSPSNIGTVSGGSSITFSVASGSVCTLSESTSNLPSAPSGYVWAAHQLIPNQVTVSSGVTSTVIARNTLAPIPTSSGVLTLTKTISGTGTGPFTVTVNGPSGYLTTTTINGGQSKVITGLLSGIYTVTETSPGAGWTTTYTATTGYSTGSSAVVSLTNPITATAFAATPITGTVFNDYNSDGLITADGTVSDTGVSGVIVTAYDQNGSVVGSATSAANGTYIITPTASGPYRVEFTNLPSGYEPTRRGNQNGTSVQFVNTVAGARNVNLGILAPCDYCQDNPNVAVTRMYFGAYTLSTTVGSAPAVALSGTLPIFPFSSSGTGTPPQNPATFAETGATYGLAWQPTSASLFQAAYLKRHSGFGPGGSGAIYRTDSAGNTSLFIDINTIDFTGADPHTGQPTLRTDVNTFALVGKRSLGDIELSSDEQTLYVVNLNSQRLLALPIGTIPTAPTAAQVGQFAIPAPAGCIDPRPFAIGVKGATVYVGGVCSAESTQNRNDLSAYVYAFTPGATATSGSFGVAPVLTFNLTYARGWASLDNVTCSGSGGSLFSGTDYYCPGEWRPYTNTWPINNPITPSLPIHSYPQPMLTDIAFDNNGDMMLGLRDRFGDQTGPNATDLNGTTFADGPTTAGDLLRACVSGSSWQIEQNANCGGITTSGVPANEEPTGTVADTVYEYYFGESYLNVGSNPEERHRETAQGGLVQIPGYLDVMAVVMNPPAATDGPASAAQFDWLGAQFQNEGLNNSNQNSGGVSRFRNRVGVISNTTTDQVGTLVQPGYRLFKGSDTAGLFAKTNGLGDVEALCDPAPIEIGNRVWWDIDGDGVQDAGEPGLSGVQVTLQTPVGSINTTTDINGNYYFTREATTGAYSTTLRTNTNYTITIGTTPSGYSLTTPNAQALAGASVSSNHAISDVRDSDAVLVSNIPTIYYTTGSAGQNNHGLDFGFVKPAIGIAAITNIAPVTLGNRLWIENDNDGNASTGTITPVVGQVVTATDGTTVYTGTTDVNGIYTITVPANKTYTVTTGLPSGYLDTPTLGGNTGANPVANNDKNHDRTGTTVVVTTTGNLSIDFGFTPILVNLGDRLWVEGDNDGNASTGTVTPVVGQVVTATDGTTIYTATTDANGIYTITVPANKTYTVTTGLPAGYLDTPTLGGNTGTNPVGNNDKNHDRNGTTVVVTTTGNLSIDFGFTPILVNLGDRLWVEGDHDGNASTGTVTPVVGQVVTATDGTNIYTAITDSNGFYTITVPANKTYTVTTGLPAGYLDTPTLGGNTGTNPAGNNDKNHDRVGTTVVVTTTDNLSIDFVFWQPLRLGNLVWIDTNNNGVVDGAESGVQGVTVTLSLSGTVIATTTTDAAGHYTFTNLVEGSYIVNIPAANFLPGAPLAGYTSSSDPVSAADVNNDTDDDDDGTGTVAAVSSPAITLAPNSEPISEDGDNNSNLTVDFGFFIPVSLGNRLFYDTNNDGLDNDGNGSANGSSVGIANALVQLYRDSNGNGSFDAGDSLLLTTTTNSSGYYTFTNLAPTTSPTSTYLVVITSSNFITGGALAGYLSSSDIGSTLNPDANLDFDDNGETQGTLGQPGGLVASRAITLTVNGEPTGENNGGNDPTDDNDSNQTLDFGFLRYDLGDLPDPTYPTLLASNGARHLIDPLANPILGVTIDSEYDGQPSGGAGGDDVNGDDEDGVTIPLLEPNVTVTITLVYSNPTAGNVYLNGWIDFNQDGTVGAGEQIITDVVAAPGSGTLNVPIFVPASAQPGDVFARFRISSDSGLSMTGSASDGEVEDYIALVPPVDLGDLPDIYNTSKTHDGARHVIDGVTRLDGSVDDEADGVPGTNANGDNLANLNDEDGVQWPPVFLPNASTSITVSVVTTDSAFLNAWIDWNGDGDFNDTLERIVVTDTSYTSGTHIISINTPAFITDTLYARFRLTDNPGEATEPTGLAPSGEVEDYVLMSLGNTIWLDNGQGGGIANNGKLDGGEKGVANVALELYRSGDNPLTATPVATTTTDAAGHYLFNGLQPGDYVVHIPSENFDAPGDPLYAALSSTGAGNPNDNLDETSDENGIDDANPAANGISSAAITLSIGDEPTNDGNGANGNLTLDFGFVTYDRGDLPDGPYATLIANNGASHIVSPDLRFGSTVDVEPNGQPSLNANGDDTTGTPDDEDGIVFMTPLMPSQNATISLTAYVTPGLTAYYGAFIDFNGDGDFGDAGEILTGTVTNGTNVLNLTVPNVVSDTVYSRFRISTDASKLATATGAAPNGEVEDYVLMSLGNQLWFDNGTGTANNGLLDGGEQPVPAGVTLTLVVSGTTTPIATTTTDASGHYTFTGLAQGNYQVIVAASNFQPGGKLVGYVGSTGQDSGDSTNNNDNGADVNNPALSGIPSNGVTLILGSEPTNDGNGANSNLTVDFGLYKLLVGDSVWNDLNNNGLYDSGEPPLPNVSVTLLDNSGKVITTTTTDSNGLYTFTSLISGTYVISVTPPANYVSSTPTTNNDGGNNTDHGTPNGNSIVSQPFALTPGAGTGTNETNDPTNGLTYNKNLDFGLWQPLSLGNRVWYDTNDNGIHDGGELGVAGVTLTLLDNSGNPVTSTVTGLPITATTNANGYYTFTNLISGTYKVQVNGSNFLAGAPLANYRNSDFTEANADSNVDLQDNGINPASLAAYLSNGVTSGAVVLSAGSEPTGEDHLGAADNSTNTNYTVDFGFYKLSVGDLVWNDINNNGQVDSGEPVLPNVPVALLDNSGNVISTTTTNSNGLYTFTGLISGTYVISVTPPANYVSSTGQDMTDGNNNHDHGTPNGNAVTSQPFALTPGSESTLNNATGATTNPNLDFGLWQPLELGNRVWYDADNGGDLDSGEMGLAGVKLTLLDGSGNSVTSTVTGLPITATTDSGGYYTFTNLISGTYKVWVDASNFQTGGTLQGYLSSTPTEANPNSDVDNNDNGIDPASNAAYLSNGVLSGLVTLSAGNEPTNETNESSTGLADNNSNLSVDFGFLLWDRGDLPNAATATNSPAYSTTVADGGPSHIIIPGLHLGASEDGEMDGQPTATANGDDANGKTPDDEDGVTLPAFSAGRSAVVNVSVVNTTGVDAYVYGFIDFNGDGDFDDSGETVDTVVPGDGSVSSVALTFTVPVAADDSQLLGARFRISSDDTLTANGAAPDGEVEDYLISVKPYDLGDLPALYPTSLTEDGARHIINSGLYFGASVDNEGDGQPSSTALGDDNNGTPDDEDGIVFMTPLMPGKSASISLTAYITPGLTAYYGAMIDFNGDGIFSASEIFTGTMVNGQKSLSLTVPGVVSDTVYSRFRLSSDPTIVGSPIGEAPDGEVEDYALMSLGNQIWFDTGAGTNNNGIFDQGIESPVPAGVTVTLVISGTNTPIATTTTDANGKYLFTGLSEGNYQVVIASQNFLPGRLLEGYASSGGEENGDTVDNNDNGVDGTFPPSTGIASTGVNLTLGAEPTNDGNGALSNLTIDFGLLAYDMGDLPNGSTASNSPAYSTTVTDGGAYHLLVDGLHIGATEDAEYGGQPTAAADGDDSHGAASDDEDGVILPHFIPGKPAVVVVNLVNTTGITATIYGFIDFNGNGILDDVGEVASGSVATSGKVLLSFNVPVDADVTQQLGARFRLGLDGEVSLDKPVGDVLSGEVEDYLINMQPILGAIGNYVWLDENADGQQDAGEPGLPNVIVTMVDDQGNSYTTTTDSQGGYLFPDLPKGIYTVTVAPENFNQGGALEGMEQTPFFGGDEDFGNKDQNGYTIDLSWGEENLSADFGYNPLPPTDVNNNDGLAALGDRVWIDSDGDGVQDPNETPVQGVVLTLYTDPDGNGVFDTAIATDTTDANGNYLFDDLPAGAYVVKVTDSSAASHDVLSISKYTQTGDPDHFATSGSNNDNLSTSPVVLAPGDLFLNVDFGYQPQPSAGLNSVGDTIWFDADADGNGMSQAPVDGGSAVTQGAGGSADVTDYGIAGITVALVKDINGNGAIDAGEPIIASDVTDSQGQYLFSGLADGKYIVKVTDTDNVLQAFKPTYDKDDGTTSPDEMSAVDLDSAHASAVGIHDRLQDFGYTSESQQPGMGLVGDTIWFDSNRDGVQNPNESGIEGVLVVLTEPSGLTQTAVTDENGHYTFGGLPLNQIYTVTVAPANFAPGGVLEGMENTGDKEQDKNNTTTSELLTSSAPVDLTNDLGYAAADTNPIGRVGNLVWLDSNADGLWDGANGPDGMAGNDDDEPLIGGVTLDLYRDLNGNGKVDAGEPRIASTTTTSTPVTTSGDLGNYLFDNLPVVGNGDGDADAEYVVDVTDVNGVLAGYWHSLGTSNTTDNSQSDPDAVEISSATPENLTADFGYYVEPAAVGNYVWVDTNGDGLQNDGETGINAVKVTLVIAYPNGTTITVTTVTTNDANGNPGWYSFGNLLIDEDHNGSGTNPEPTYTISVSHNQPALAAYQETLVDVNSNASDKLDSDLHSGVVAQPVQGLTDTTAKDPANNEGTIASYDFGYYIPASLGNYVWLDENADGAQDEGEPGLPNVVVVATDDKGNTYTTTTDSHGGYLFTDLVPGVYTVTVPVSNFAPGGTLEGMEQTLLTGGNDSPDFGNKDDAGYSVTLSSGEENLTADFGYNPLPPTDVNDDDGLAALGDRVWIDIDGDGVQDPNETPVQGAVLTLYTDPDGNGVFDTAIATDTTDANGYYLFTDLPAGAYVVKVTDSSTASHDVLSTSKYTQTGDPDHFASNGTNNDNLSTTPVVLAPGDLFLNVDFGYQPLPATGLNSVGDTIWFDADADGNGPAQPAVDGGATVTQGAGGTADAAEYGIAGVTVALIHDINGNGLFDAGEPIIATDVTDGKGQYLFAGLADGKYIVQVTDSDHVLDGLKPTWDKDDLLLAPDEMSAVDLDSVGANATGINDRLQDFGYTPFANDGMNGLIGDTIWFDSNRDGVQNPNEPGIEGVVVIMTDMAGNPLASTTTDENGHYYFGGLPLNEQYKVVVSPENFVPGGVLEGMENTGDKEQDKNNTTTSELLTSVAPIDLTNDLGYAANHNNPIGRVGNLVWLDSNADGVWDKDGADNRLGTDDDEPLIGDVTLDLYRDLNGNGKVDAGEPRIASTTTTSTPVTTSGDLGNYLFDNLPVVGNGDGDAAAEYVVDVTDVNGVLAGYWHSLGTIGSTNNSQADPYGVEISTTQPENLTADFGYYVEPAAVGNYVWVDSNGDGVQNDGETGLNGVEVTLKIVYPNGTTITVTTVTTDDISGNPGWYSFGNLLIDEDQNGDNLGSEPVHTISVDLTQAALAGYKSTLLDQGSNDRLDADNPAGVVANPVQGQTDTHASDPASNEPTIASYDFGFYEPASLGDRVWFDNDRDGVQDSGEVGVSGVKVELLDKNGTVISNTLTDASGIYTFAELLPGVYSVRFTPPAGYAISPANQGDDALDSDANPTTGQTITTTLVSGENDPTWDAGLYAVVNLGNLVWHDANNDGLFNNGEQGIEGVTLQLFQAGDDPTTATPLLTTTTDVSGTYLFTNLLPGKYFVYIPTPPVAYPVSSTPTDSADNGEDNDDNGTQSALGQPVISPIIDLSPNSEPSNDGDGKNGDLTIDFGFFAPASLGDLVWFDTDKDGVQDSIETGTPGSTDRIGVASVLVTLFKADGTQVATTTTDIHGYYRFDNLLPGDYYVEFTPPAGYKISPTDTVTGTDVYDSDGLRTPVTNLTSGEHDPTLDLGLYLDTQPASIGDTVWLDTDKDGVQDAGESGIPGVKVMLFSADGTPVASTLTDLNGHYFFGSLVPGDYYVQFVAPDGLTPSPKDAGNNDGLDSDADLATGKTIVTTLDPGENDPTWDAGFYSPTPLASLGDKVWYDLNANGIQDANETGVPGVVVKLFDGTGQLIATTTTDVQGVYGFNNLLPGDYYVEFTPIKKYIFSPQDKGQDDGEDSDVDPYTHRTVTTTLTAGENDPTWDAGIYVPGEKGVVQLPVSLGDRVWEDQNHDGIQDANEPGIPGVTVKLYTDQGELIAWTVTDATGYYHFDNLPAGAYYVEFVPPAEYYISPTKVPTGTDINDSDMDPGTGRSPIVDLPPGTDDPDLDAGLYKIPTSEDGTEEPEANKKLFLPVISR